MSHHVRLIAFFIVWGTGLFGVLQLRRLGEAVGGAHGICGPWGCGPPVSALLAWHGFWLVLLAGPACIALWSWPVRWTRRVGGLLLGCGLVCAGGVVVWEAVTWLPRLYPGEPTYFAQRCLFSLMTLVDLPILPAALVGLLLVSGSRVRASGAAGSSLSPTPEKLPDHATRRRQNGAADF